jgi:8-oxo-dGTP pyrophosphatase MutT (NUDIX family)
VTGVLVAAGALVTDDEGRVLVVEPVYKTEWEIPGGRVEEGESPRAACARELTEELGLVLEPGHLLVVDWAPRAGRDRLRFVFDAGTLTAEQRAAIVLPPGELASWEFLAPADLGTRLGPWLVRRVAAALVARSSGTTSYLEHGVTVG